uniref:RRM domain-containing protein n=1 Tax=Kalanchoe fedtschenkoi TaxID=63787 RepID=A0A7N1A2D8_KALFE
MSSRAARPIFCGNLDYDARQSDIERLFGKYGKVEKVDLKSGFAFVYMEDDQDADDAVRRLDRREFGPKGRRLRVEWTKQDRGGRQYGDSRKASMKSQPSRTLFIINFDPIITRLRDLERHFDSYGKIINVRIRRNFAFVQFETQEEATKALDATNSSKFMDRILSVEYATRDDDDNQRSDDRRNGRSPDRRGRDRSPERGYNSRRSPSPLRRDRDSPDYGHGSKPISRYEPRRSPNYERTDKSLVNNVDIKRSSRHERQRSPSYERQRSPSNDSPGRSPVNDRDTKLNYDGPDRSPANDDGAMLSSEHEPYESPIYGRTKRSPGGARDSSRSPSPTER